MRHAGWLSSLAVVLVTADLAGRVTGLAEHTSVLAGMPHSEASWILGPVYVALHLAAVVVAPVLLLASGLALLTKNLTPR